MNKTTSWLIFFGGILLFGFHGALALAATGVTVSPSSIDFGNVTVGMFSDDFVITVTNNTSASIQVNSFSILGTQFPLNQGVAPYSVSPGKSAYYTLEFVPDAAQTFTGTFFVDVQNFGVMTVSLTGVGLSTGAIASVTPTTIDFGNVVQGTNSAQQIVTVTNSGTTPLKFNSVQISPPFKTSTITAKTLSPGQSTTFQVMMSPPGTSTYTNTLTIGYDVLPPTGISLKGSGTAASSLKIATFSPLALAVKGAAYSAPITAVGGTPPYSFSLQAGSTLPAGLSLSSAGMISGTVDSNVGTANYSFVVKAQDSTSATITKSITISVQLSPGSNCSNISWNITGTSTPIVPLDVLGTGTYLGSVGGLYPGGSNVRPAGHDAYGLQLSQALQPLDANGNPDPAGKEVLLLLGESIARLEGERLVLDAKADPAKNPNLVVVDGAQGNGTAGNFSPPDSVYWDTVINYDLPNAGVTANQVVVAWVEITNAITSGTFPSDISKFTDQLKTMAQSLLLKFPNIKIAYFSTRFYGGYSNGLAHLINEEPYAYEIGFGVKALIEAQLGGDPNLNYDPNVGPVTAPWLAWGPYYWSNGLIPNGNGLVWACPEIQDDGTHPTKLRGSEKVANEVLNFFKADSTAVPWYVAGSMSFTPSSLTFGNQSVGTSSSPQPITVSNTGSTALAIDAIVMAGDYSESDNCVGNVAAGGNCTINVTFTPTVPGTRSGTFQIFDNARGTPQQGVLTGIGTQVGGAIVSLSTNNLAFSDQQVGNTSAAQSIGLTNIGDGTLVITTVVMTGDFAESDNCVGSIAPGASCTLNVTFTPTTEGQRLGSLMINDNAADTPQTVSLAGNGTAASIPMIGELIPVSTAPGGPALTLTVKGNGFVSNSVVKWNGTALTTSFVSSGQLTAIVPAGNIAVAGTASITVSSSGAVGSNAMFFSITTSTASVFFSASAVASGTMPKAVASADLNADGKPDLVVVNQGANSLSVLLGNGDGTFIPSATLTTGNVPLAVRLADFNNDNKIDIAVTNTADQTLSILLGVGDGTFTAASASPVTGNTPSGLASGDVNADGKLDLIVANKNSNTVSVLMGNGDGTFQSQQTYSTGLGPLSLSVADFNGDNKLDLAVANHGDGSISILLGNGGGTFQQQTAYLTGANPDALAMADFNNDGQLDLAVTNDVSNSASVLLGNGDGTFSAHVDYATGATPSAVATADVNGDGQVDLAVENSAADSTWLLLGTGTGTFQNGTSYSTGIGPSAVAIGDFNGDGRLDLAVANAGDNTLTILLQAPQLMLSNNNLSFGNQTVGTTSSPLSVTITNNGSALLLFSGFAVTGDFSQTNTCGASLNPGANCAVSVTFTPTVVGTRTGAVTITDNASGSPHVIALSGTGVIPTVGFSPTSLTFPVQLINTPSSALPVTLTNTGNGTLTISDIGTTGNFSQSNNCGSSLAAGASCTINVTFTPTAIGNRQGTLSVTDNGVGSPQTVPLSGIGTKVNLVPKSLTFGNQQVGTTSAAQSVTMTNVGSGALAISSITLNGNNPGDFAQTNNCGSTLAGGASCTFNVTFTPTKTGTRLAKISIADNGGASPQVISLKGTGI